MQRQSVTVMSSGVPARLLLESGEMTACPTTHPDTAGGIQDELREVDLLAKGQDRPSPAEAANNSTNLLQLPLDPLLGVWDDTPPGDASNRNHHTAAEQQGSGDPMGIWPREGSRAACQGGRQYPPHRGPRRRCPDKKARRPSPPVPTHKGKRSRADMAVWLWPRGFPASGRSKGARWWCVQEVE